METIRKNISSVILTIFVIIISTVIYAPMLAYQEGLQIFMSGSEFFAETCNQPGGLSDYIGCFLVQFFIYPLWTAVILTITIVGVQMVTKSIFSKRCTPYWADFLSVTCALGMVAALAYTHTVFNGLVAILLAVIAVKLADVTKNIVILTIATPLVYWITGGWCCIIYILGASLAFDNKKGFIALAINALLLTFSFVITKRILQDDSFHGYFVGVEYNRYDKEENYSWYIAIAAIYASMILSKINVKFNRLAIQIPLYAIVAVGLLSWMAQKYNKSAMLYYKLDKMVRFKQWSNIVKTMASESDIASSQSLCYLNVALNELGLLGTKMFDIMQTGPEGLASSEINNTDKSIYNSEIYFRLGLLNISERLAIDAMESVVTHQKSARQYKRLAEINIIRYDKPLAMRYIKKLQKTTFYSAWADRAEQYLNDSTHTEPLSDWKMQPLNMDKDVFFAPATKSDVFLHLLVNNPHNKKVLNYYLGYLLLEKNVKKAYEFLASYRPEGEMGVYIYEAILLYHFLYNKEEFNKIMSQENDLTKRFRSFGNFISSSEAQNTQKAKELFGKTYWYYYQLQTK